ncbi:hypothetical protein ABR763_01155 [Bacillus cereus]
MDTLMTIEEFKTLSEAKKRTVRKNWRVCPLERWNATTARSYMNELCEIRCKQPYVCNNILIENSMLSAFIKQYGKEALKLFIHRAFSQYKPTEEYPTLTFAFMNSYMKERLLPPILKEIREKTEREEALKRQAQQKKQQIKSQAEFF